MKVLCITNIPAPYRVDFFNELGKYCELTVLFEKRKSTERDESWDNYCFKNFKGVFLKGISINTDTAICFGIGKFIKKGKYDKIICMNFTSPTGMIAIHYMRRHKMSYYLEGDGGFAKTGQGIKERIKKHFIKGAEGYFSTSSEFDNYFLKYGATKEKIYRYPFSSLWKNDILKQKLTVDEQHALRSELGMKEKNILLSVGQFVYRKGFDVLIKSLKDIVLDLGVYIIGGKQTEEYTSLLQEMQLKNVHFLDFKNKKELWKYYKAADVFVLPTREDIWGLVINEAMANGLPIITTNRCIAGLELVDNNKNGYIVPINDVVALHDKILNVFANGEEIFEMGKNSLNKIKDYTIENMVYKHLELFGGDFGCDF